MYLRFIKGRQPISGENIMNTIEKIKTAVAEANLSATSCKSRPVGCPMQCNASIELQALSKYEYHAAFLLGLFGNNGHTGTIVINAKN